jgi:[protein-PII] uridylyltransferase
MSPEHDGVFERAVTQLKESSRRGSELSLDAFRRFRKINEHRLLMAHNAGGSGRELARRRSDLTDVIFRELFDQVATETFGRKRLPEIAVIAFGGYGRREMNPLSDVDIMFLLSSPTLSPNLGEVVRKVTTHLWDIGFKVGHSVRSIAQAVQQANEDLLTKTSMLECRYLTGDRELFLGFRKKFESACLAGKEEEYIAWRLQNQKELHERFGETVFMQEPNVKGGRGGLRDVQNLLWIAYAHERAQSLSRLVELRVLRENERRKIEAGYDFLLRVRSQMHYLNKRPLDNLTLQMQGKVATAFNYPQKNILRRVEAFMRDTYSHTRNIALLTDSAIDRLPLKPASRRRKLFQIFQKPSSGEQFDGFIAKNGQLYPGSREIFTEDPARMMRGFHHAQRRQLQISPALRDLYGRSMRLVDRTFQYARVNREVFLAILSRKGEVGRILREMHNAGFLGKYLPEFGALTCLVQHEFFHRYTADEHTLVCIEKLDAVLFSQEKRLAGYRSLFQRLEDGAILYLALLLHDVGKAANRRAHEEASAELARKVSRRIQLSPERRRMLLTLVDAHYTLSKTAQSRNLDDPFTVTEFSTIVRNPETLDALMLLTLADGMGTSDQNWSDWKESLVWQLYRQTLSYLKTGDAGLERRQADWNQLLATVLEKLPRDFPEEARAHFEQMPERYFAAFDAETIREHLRLFRRFFERLAGPEENVLHPTVQWIDRPEQGHSEVWVCGWDRTGFLERIAGSFSASGLNILSADVFTRADSLVLDIFRVCDLRHNAISSAKDKARFAEFLNRSQDEEDFDFRPFFQAERGMKFYRLSQEFDLPTKVTVENSFHPLFTLVEIQTPDHPGLLYDLLSAFHEAGASIVLSRITTEMDVALDTFYVTDRSGNKIPDDGTIERLQRLLQKRAVRSA